MKASMAVTPESQKTSHASRRPETAPGHARSDPQREKRRRIMESDVDEDNRQRIKAAMGSDRSRTPRQVRRINCPSRWPKEAYYGMESSEKLDTDDSSQKEKMSVSSFSETEVQPGFVVRDRRFSKHSRQRSSRKDPNWEPQNRIEAAVHDLLKHDQLPAPELQPEIIQHVKYESAQALVNKDYDRAAQLEAVYHLVNDGLEWQANELMKVRAKEILDEKIEEAKSRLAEEEQKWDRILSQFYDQQERERETLMDAHDEQMQDFEERWSDESAMTKYSKPTRELIELRQREKVMALVKHFEDAKHFCQKADELEVGLAAEAEDRAAADMVKQHDVMMEKQKREVECFDQHEKRIELFLQAEREKAISPIMKQIEQLENRRRQGAPTNKKPKGTAPYVATTRTRVCRDAKAIPKRNEETTRALSEFKSREEVPRLAVRALNVRRILVENKRPASVTRTRRNKNVY